MTISEKTAYLKGLTDGLGIDPASKEGKLWAALNDLLGDIARELDNLRETDRGQAQALDGVADELSYLEELCGGFDSEDDDDPVCGRCSRLCERSDEEGYDDEDDEEPEFDGVIYDATCPVCGKEISFDEETLEQGSIQCPNCGETLEFDLGGEEDEKDEVDAKTPSGQKPDNDELPF